MKHKIFQATAILAVVALISGASILATASPGTATDPLITYSYLTGPFLTLINNDITTQLGGLNTRIANAETKISGELAAAQGNTANAFSIKSITSAASLIVPAGSEILLESGSASFTGGLVRLSGTDNAAASSGDLVANNLYLATGEITLTVASGTAKVWVRTAPIAIGSQGFEFDPSQAPDPGLELIPVE